MITTYFHRNPARTVDMLSDFYRDRFHKDFLSCAGVIFLNPDPPPMTGTSILDGRNIKFINVENVYNRLISYDGYDMHGLTGCFGDSPETDRLTIVFLFMKGYLLMDSTKKMITVYEEHIKNLEKENKSLKMQIKFLKEQLAYKTFGKPNLEEKN